MKFRILIIVVYSIFIVGCSKSKDVLGESFSKIEQSMINELILLYDNFVLKETNDSLEIQVAYQAFFEKRCPEACESGDLEKLLPLSRLTNANTALVISSIDSIIHSENYMAFLKTLSSRSYFFRIYYESAERDWLMSPEHYSMVLHDFNKIDYKKKEERFVVILNLLHPLLKNDY